MQTPLALFSSADSKRIVEHVNDPVGMSIPEGVSVIEVNKSLFDDSQLTGLAKAIVDPFKSNHETFSLAVGAKLSVHQVLHGRVEAGKIDAVLQAASLHFAL